MEGLKILMVNGAAEVDVTAVLVAVHSDSYKAIKVIINNHQ